jgi:hypothetical protein
VELLYCHFFHQSVLRPSKARDSGKPACDPALNLKFEWQQYSVFCTGRRAGQRHHAILSLRMDEYFRRCRAWPMPSRNLAQSMEQVARHIVPVHDRVSHRSGTGDQFRQIEPDAITGNSAHQDPRSVIGIENAKGSIQNQSGVGAVQALFVFAVLTVKLRGARALLGH